MLKMLKIIESVIISEIFNTFPIHKVNIYAV